MEKCDFFSRQKSVEIKCSTQNPWKKRHGARLIGWLHPTSPYPIPTPPSHWVFATDRRWVTAPSFVLHRSTHRNARMRCPFEKLERKGRLDLHGDFKNTMFVHVYLHNWKTCQLCNQQSKYWTHVWKKKGIQVLCKSVQIKCQSIDVLLKGPKWILEKPLSKTPKQFKPTEMHF